MKAFFSMNNVLPEAPFFVGIDIGGTNIKVGVVDNNGQTLSFVTGPTHPEKGTDAGLQTIKRLVTQAVEESSLSYSEITAIGLASPGTMDIPGGKLLDPTNLPTWNDFPIREKVEELLQKPTILQNDANAAAYGEFWVGGAHDVNSLVFWTLGTGIGCGIIIHDLVIEGQNSHGGECGHIIIEMDNGRYHGSGQYGTLEAYASATALIARCQEALEEGRSSTIQLEVASGQEITPLLIAQAAEEGDELANELIMDTAKFMGVGTVTLMHTIDPTVVLFGGAMTFGRNETELGQRFLQRIKDEVKERAFPVPYQNTRIDYATLGGDAGYIGAAGCARLKYGKK